MSFRNFGSGDRKNLSRYPFSEESENRSLRNVRERRQNNDGNGPIGRNIHEELRSQCPDYNPHPHINSNYSNNHPYLPQTELPTYTNRHRLRRNPDYSDSDDDVQDTLRYRRKRTNLLYDGVRPGVRQSRNDSEERNILPSRDSSVGLRHNRMYQSRLRQNPDHLDDDSISISRRDDSLYHRETPVESYKRRVRYRLWQNPDYNDESLLPPRENSFYQQLSPDVSRSSTDTRRRNGSTEYKEHSVVGRSRSRHDNSTMNLNYVNSRSRSPIRADFTRYRERSRNVNQERNYNKNSHHYEVAHENPEHEPTTSADKAQKRRQRLTDTEYISHNHELSHDSYHRKPQAPVKDRKRQAEFEVYPPEINVLRPSSYPENQEDEYQTEDSGSDSLSSPQKEKKFFIESPPMEFADLITAKFKKTCRTVSSEQIRIIAKQREKEEELAERSSVIVSEEKDSIIDSVKDNIINSIDSLTDIEENEDKAKRFEQELLELSFDSMDSEESDDRNNIEPDADSEELSFEGLTSIPSTYPEGVQDWSYNEASSSRRPSMTVCDICNKAFIDQNNKTVSDHMIHHHPDKYLVQGDGGRSEVISHSSANSNPSQNRVSQNPPSQESNDSVIYTDRPTSSNIIDLTGPSTHPAIPTKRYPAVLNSDIRLGIQSERQQLNALLSEAFQQSAEKSQKEHSQRVTDLLSSQQVVISLTSSDEEVIEADLPPGESIPSSLDPLPTQTMFPSSQPILSHSPPASPPRNPATRSLSSATGQRYSPVKPLQSGMRQAIKRLLSIVNEKPTHAVKQ